MTVGKVQASGEAGAWTLASGAKRFSACPLMSFASSSSPTKTVPMPSLRSITASPHHRLFFNVRAQDDFNLGIEGACCVSHLAHVKRIGHCHNQHVSIGDVGLNQHRRIGGISRYGDDALIAHVFDQFAILLGVTVVNAARLQRAGNPLARS